MAAIVVDAQDFDKAAKALGAAADQIPFIMSLTLNRAVKETRGYLIEETWPGSIIQRNPGFIRAALQTKFSSKQNLEVDIHDALGRVPLKMHAEGGIKTPQKSNTLAVPTKQVKQTSRGPAQSQRPRNLRNSFVKKGRIYQTVGKGKSRRLKVMYFLKKQVEIKAEVPFYTDFTVQMTKNIDGKLQEAVIKAMSTRLAGR